MRKVTKKLVAKKEADSDFLIHIFIPISASALVLTAKGLHLKKGCVRGLLGPLKGEVDSLLDLGSEYALQVDVESSPKGVSLNTRGTLMEMSPLEKTWSLSFSIPEDLELKVD